MGFKKIEEADLIGKLVSDLQDTPEMTAGELKEHFDRLSKEAIIPRFNELVDDLHAETAAEKLGMTVPEGIEAEGNVGAVIGEIAEIAKDNERVKHSHENKSVLDLITELVKEGYDRLVLLFQNIKSISDTVSDDSTQLPTGKAIVAYVKKLGAGDMQTPVYDENANGIVDDSEKLGGELPSAYQKVTDQTLQTQDKTVPGAINELFNRKQASSASDIKYDNSASGLQATNGQGAIDELAASFTTAAKVIGDAIVAKGVTVPSGSSAEDMATLITNNLFCLPSSISTTNAKSGTAPANGYVIAMCRFASNGYLRLTIAGTQKFNQSYSNGGVKTSPAYKITKGQSYSVESDAGDGVYSAIFFALG